MTSQIGRVRAVFKDGLEMTSVEALKIAGIEGPVGRSILNRLRTRKEIISIRDTYPPRYRAQEKPKVEVIPNVGITEQALGSVPRSIFDIGRL